MKNLICEKEKCTACGACVQICPRQCIKFIESDGDKYPVIDEEKCVECGLCKKSCPTLNEIPGHAILNAYAVCAKENYIRMRSASGGAFACLAHEILEQGGVVFGCAMNSELYVEHVMIENKNELSKIQGSKYVYSDGKDCYLLAKKELEKGRRVLYSGTPCQIAGLYGFLKKDYEFLITVDLVCHGTPSYRLFKDYLADYEKFKKCHILEYNFRTHTTKKKSMKYSVKAGYYGSVTYKKNKTITKPLLWTCDSYYSYFMHGAMYRENCYSCKYAVNRRVSDITLGDFWGIEKLIPEERAGNISLVLTNTVKGDRSIKKNIEMEKRNVDISEAIKYNGQLNYPMKKPVELRKKFFELYLSGGWKAVRMDFYSKNKKRRMISRLAYYTPEEIKQILHKVRKQ